MHDSVLAWVGQTLQRDDIAGRRVLEVGSYDVNGSVRPTVEALEPLGYLGVDQSAGPGVDLCVEATDLSAEGGADAFDVVISTEMMEHVVDWRPIITQMVEVLAPGGLLLITTRGPGFPYHPYPIDTWRYTIDAMQALLLACGLILREVVSDAQAPGVFARATKPMDWTRPWRPGLFDNIAVEAMVAP